MNTAKKLSLLAGVAALGLTLSACSGGGIGNSSGDTKTTELKVAFNQTESHPQYVAMENFGKRLSEATDGRYTVKMYPNELLGAQQETITGVQSGTIDMSIVVGSLMENVNPDFVAFNLPYAFDNVEQQMSVLNDDSLVGDLYSSLESQNITVAGAFHSGIRNVYVKDHAIETPADLAGQKVRVIQNDTMIDMMNRMGGVGTPMGQGDVYTAIQSGVLNGGENNELIYSGLKHFEVAGFYSYTKHLMVPDYLIASSKMLAAMDDADRKVFETEFAKAIDEEVELWGVSVTEAIETAKAAGAQFNEPDTAPFKAAVQPLVDAKLDASPTARELYDAVQKRK